MKKIKILVIMLLVGVALTSIFFIYKEIIQNKKQEETFEQLTEIAEGQVKDENEKEEINLLPLYEINNEK